MTVRVTACGNPSLPALVLVHGWGHSSGVWDALLPTLQKHFYVQCVDLPGYGCTENGGTDVCDNSATQWQLDSLLQDLATLPPAIWCGWSLGGLLATRLATVEPQRVTGLVTIASNPVFVEKPTWLMAMPSEEYQQFVNSVGRDARTTVSRFLSLVCQGAATSRADSRVLKKIVAAVKMPSPAILQASLQCLNTLDTRSDITALKVPQHHLLGEHDALIPVAVAKAISGLNNRAKVSVIAGAGHAPLLSHPHVVVDALLAMTQGLNDE
jgi:pimeloyl-[acyl-carrier protein] methyl ester esterase